MSKSDKSRKPRPRFTGYGRPVYHQHGSRRALVERQDSRSAIKEQEEEPLADWERELLAGADARPDIPDWEYAELMRSPVVDNRPAPNPFSIGMGFIPGSERRPSQAELDQQAERRRQEKLNAWIASAERRRELDDTVVRSLTRPSDPAKRITAAHRIRVTDVALAIGLTNVQTIYLLNTVCNEYVKSANSMVASIVATDLKALLDDPDARMVFAKILAENGMGEIR